jgi:hypothetical protein
MANRWPDDVENHGIIVLVIKVIHLHCPVGPRVLNPQLGTGLGVLASTVVYSAGFLRVRPVTALFCPPGSSSGADGKNSSRYWMGSRLAEMLEIDVICVPKFGEMFVSVIRCNLRAIGSRFRLEA